MEKKIVLVAFVLVLLVIGGCRGRFRQQPPINQPPVVPPTVPPSVIPPSQPPVSSAYSAGEFRESMMSGGRERTYIIHVPTGFSAQNKYPLVVLLHGGRGSGENILHGVSFNKKADREGFIVVAPDGIDQNWADGRGATQPDKDGVNDVQFIRELVISLQSKLPIDQKRIYAAGASNGGMMTQRLGCEMADVFAAIGPVIGPVPANIVPKCSPTQPISVIGIQGKADPLIPFNGGEEGGAGGFGEGGLVSSAETTISLWVSKNKCGTTPKTEELPVIVNDGTTVTKRTYNGCSNGVEINYYLVDGMGHTWPPLAERFPRISGQNSQNIDATNVIWNFFKLHPKQ